MNPDSPAGWPPSWVISHLRLLRFQPHHFGACTEQIREPWPRYQSILFGTLVSLLSLSWTTCSHGGSWLGFFFFSLSLLLPRLSRALAGKASFHYTHSIPPTGSSFDLARGSSFALKALWGAVWEDRESGWSQGGIKYRFSPQAFNKNCFDALTLSLSVCQRDLFQGK